MTVWLVVDGASPSSGTWHASEAEARRSAKAANGALGYYGTKDVQAVRAETVEPAGPLFRDEASALLAGPVDGAPGE